MKAAGPGERELTAAERWNATSDCGISREPVSTRACWVILFAKLNRRVFAVKARAEESGSRDLLIRQRTQSINAFRAHLAELGIVAAQGDAGVTELLAIVADEQDTRLPIDARASVIVLAAQLDLSQRHGRRAISRLGHTP